MYNIIIMSKKDNQFKPFDQTNYLLYENIHQKNKEMVHIIKTITCDIYNVIVKSLAGKHEQRIRCTSRIL